MGVSNEEETRNIYKFLVDFLQFYTKIIDIITKINLLTWVYVVGYFRKAASLSKFAGSFCKMSSATSVSTSSSDFPPDDEARA